MCLALLILDLVNTIIDFICVSLCEPWQQISNKDASKDASVGHDSANGCLYTDNLNDSDKWALKNHVRPLKRLLFCPQMSAKSSANYYHPQN